MKISSIRTQVTSSANSKSTSVISSIQAFTNSVAGRFKPLSMDWTTPGDIHKRFKLFKEKCELIFAGPLEKAEEAKKVRLLLLWIGDKGLEIYNTSTWANDGDNLKIAPVMATLEAYTKPQSNQILTRYQLRFLKQGDRPVEEFVTEARLLKMADTIPRLKKMPSEIQW